MQASLVCVPPCLPSVHQVKVVKVAADPQTQSHNKAAMLCSTYSLPIPFRLPRNRHSGCLISDSFQGELVSDSVSESCDTLAGKCEICQNDLRDLCVECQVVRKPEECIAEFGACSHVFHMHCMSGWLKNNVKCPVDSCVEKW